MLNVQEETDGEPVLTLVHVLVFREQEWVTVRMGLDRRGRAECGEEQAFPKAVLETEIEHNHVVRKDGTHAWHIRTGVDYE